MSEIIIMPKRDNTTYDELFNIINSAHAQNREKNIVVNPDMTDAEKLKDSVSKDDTVFVAYDGERAVGTATAGFVTGTRRFVKGKKLVSLTHLAVLPEYGGKGIGKMLCNAVEDYARENNIDTVELYVRENNDAIKLYKRCGYVGAAYFPRKSIRQYAIYMLKKTDGTKLSPSVTVFYNIQRAVNKIRYKYH
ncbi:MAG: GNAT family N-acetyltransferase [Clostridia bacterium]|nr:GNAT family N-acetyltransferase [Clostridia bacterium]